MGKKKNQNDKQNNQQDNQSVNRQFSNAAVVTPL
jgi:hypothetical protein